MTHKRQLYLSVLTEDTFCKWRMPERNKLYGHNSTVLATCGKANVGLIDDMRLFQFDGLQTARDGVLTCV
jgi:hypothetical protein